MILVAEDVLTKKTVSLDLQAQHYRLEPSDLSPAAGLYLSPGWLDIQVNGFAGINLSEPGFTSVELRRMVARLWQEGVAATCPTLVTGPSDLIELNLRLIAQACQEESLIEAAVAGIHLEGPYISPLEGARGAHPPAHIRPPDWDEFQRWQAASGNRIRLVTLAPEQPGALEFTRRLVQSGIVVAIGHSAADTDTIRAAVDAGATLSTHLGNGIQTLINRHANPIWDQLADDRLYASMIFDGFHLPLNVMRVFLRAKGVDRSILTSDTVSIARLAPGIYETPVGGKVELHASGRLSLYGTEYLAGSASSLKDCLEIALNQVGCSLAQAVQMVTINPQRLLGEESPDRWTLFRWEAGRLSILAVLLAGQVVYRSASIP